MFTGIVECMGTVVACGGSPVCTLIVQSVLPHHTISVGDSIAVEGCCLTVVKNEEGCLFFHLAPETLQRTTLGQLQKGDKVNLERALQVGSYLGGHWVSGHVDGVAKLVAQEERDGGWYMTFQVPQEVADLSVPRGCIILAGVALTVTQVLGVCVQVCVIPHTRAVTSLGLLYLHEAASSTVGVVNVEADLLARYLQGLLKQRM
jgi:riboflavin synthase